jgi:hypothetical protein
MPLKPSTQQVLGLTGSLALRTWILESIQSNCHPRVFYPIDNQTLFLRVGSSVAVNVAMTVEGTDPSMRVEELAYSNQYRRKMSLTTGWWLQFAARAGVPESHFTPHQRPIKMPSG